MNPPNHDRSRIPDDATIDRVLATRHPVPTSLDARLSALECEARQSRDSSPRRRLLSFPTALAAAAAAAALLAIAVLPDGGSGDPGQQVASSLSPAAEPSAVVLDFEIFALLDLVEGIDPAAVTGESDSIESAS